MTCLNNYVQLSPIHLGKGRFILIHGTLLWGQKSHIKNSGCSTVHGIFGLVVREIQYAAFGSMKTFHIYIFRITIGVSTLFNQWQSVHAYMYLKEGNAWKIVHKMSSNWWRSWSIDFNRGGLASSRGHLGLASGNITREQKSKFK